ncbi:CmcJ/NvfI family oxidoreductase [Sphingomonas profundi]|uniref:CmcJ/NvfI family oxidoreductase n=1 Tax=Alterirhizorhabdus profundi TaxID=2681549 RepID=UPI0012E85259|nr:CmcJ/NvfI family oxidoreductase [Sphingomonas profundi]
MADGDTRAMLRFLGDTPGEALYHTSMPERSRLDEDVREVAIHDARMISASIEREGFALHPHPLPAIDFMDEAQRNGPYLAAVQTRIAAALGADRVICDLSVMRLPGGATTQIPLMHVHSDFTAETARMLMADSRDRAIEDPAQADADHARIMATRWSRTLCIHAWRVLSPPPHDRPLAVCDVRSVAPEDVRAGEFIEDYGENGTYRAELRLLRHAPKQAWWSYRDMVPDELLLFLGHDYAGRDGCFHAAFHDPACPPGTPGRASIETRTFAFFA